MIPPWYWIFIEYSLKLPEGNITKIPLFADEIPIFFTKNHRPRPSGHRWNGKKVPKVGSPLLSPDSLRRAAGVKGLAERNIGISWNISEIHFNTKRCGICRWVMGCEWLYVFVSLGQLLHVPRMYRTS